MLYEKSLSENCITKLYTQSSEEFFLAQKEKLIKDGYKLFAEHEIDGNQYATFENNGEVVQIYYTPAEESVRIVSDSRAILYDTQATYDKKSSTILWQFETDHSLIDCGMCYIIRCSDGSFVILDSAHAYSVRDDIRIYEFLRQHTPDDENIVIAGWFLSHAHDDHVTKFIDFIKYMPSDVVVERIYCNFPSAEYCDRKVFLESSIEVIRWVNEFLDKQTVAPVVRIHTGYRIAIRNLIFTVLCTHEDVFPDFIDNFNDSSSVLMLEAENNRIFLPGDAGDRESILLEKRYPQFLKSDIVQVAHHGHFGLRTSCYDIIRAKLALFPTTRIKYDEEFEKLEANRRAAEYAEKVYISSEGTVEVVLPLDMDSIIQLPDETNESFEGVYNLWGYEYSEERKKELIDAYEKRKRS